MAGTVGRPPRISHAERRERRAAVEEPAVVLEAAARFLEVRARSIVEVRRRLVGAGYRADLVDVTIDRLIDYGLLDDDAFGRAWIESRERSRPRGERAIRHELALKGVDREIVERLLEERRQAATTAGGGEGSGSGGLPDEQPRSADEAAAERLLAKNRRALGRVPDPRQRRQRAYALLARNGFSPDVCRSVSATVVADTDSEEDGSDAERT
jgi:regulatory protein